MLALACLFGAVRGEAAAAHLEGFAASMGGWTNAVGTPVWRATGGVAQVAFPGSLVPQTGTLRASGDSSSAAFLGDYASAGLLLLGFSFRAEHLVPDTLTLRWLREGTGYFASLQAAVVSTGVWYRFLFTLEGKQAGGWDGDAESLFGQTLQAVDTLEIAVTKPATLATVRYSVDDLVLYPLASMGGVFAEGSAPGTWRLEGTGLLAGVTHRLESAEDLAGPWTQAVAWVAAGESMSIVVTNPAPRLFWRLELAR